MIQTGLIPSAHDDLISDAAFDYHGTRLATCGFDQKIKIWRDPSTSTSSDTNDKEANKSWILEDEFKAHDAPILSLSWAHPEFGRMLVSGSMDRTVKIWEWVPGFLGSSSGKTTVNGSGSQGQRQTSTGTSWRLHTVLTDAKGSVRAVEFAPFMFGLKLAALATDNLLRVYSCLDAEHFTNVDTVDIIPLPSAPPHSSSSSEKTNGVNGGIPIPALGSSFEDSDLPSFLTNNTNDANGSGSKGAGSRNAQGIVIKEADGGWTLSWCKDMYWGHVLAVGCGVEGIVKIVQLCTLEEQSSALLTLDPYSPSSGSLPSSQNSKLPTSSSSAPQPSVPGLTTPTSTLPPSSSQSQIQQKRYAVTSVAWAPTCGRTFHTIATGSRDGRVRVWRVKAPTPVVPPSVGGGMEVDTPAAPKVGKERWSSTLVADFSEHEYAVTKVDWNITGTILTSSGADGHVRLYKMSLGGVWRPIGGVSGQQGDLSQSGRGRKEKEGEANTGGDIEMGD